MKRVAMIFRAMCLVAVACLSANLAHGQAIGLNSSTLLGSDQEAQAMTSQSEEGDMAETTPRADWDSGTYGPVDPRAQAMVDPNTLPPFGENLFSGGFRGMMADGLNPDYLIKPGDQITIRVWGGVEIDRVLAVDAQGNIFLPRIGPLQVQGISNAQLNARVRGAIQSVYPENVSVYTNLQGVQPVGGASRAHRTTRCSTSSIRRAASTRRWAAIARS